jgi:hypothetical protein
MSSSLFMALVYISIYHLSAKSSIFGFNFPLFQRESLPTYKSGSSIAHPQGHCPAPNPQATQMSYLEAFAKNLRNPFLVSKSTL